MRQRFLARHVGNLLFARRAALTVGRVTAACCRLPPLPSQAIRRLRAVPLEFRARRCFFNIRRRQSSGRRLAFIMKQSRRPRASRLRAGKTQNEFCGDRPPPLAVRLVDTRRRANFADVDDDEAKIPTRRALQIACVLIASANGERSPICASARKSRALRTLADSRRCHFRAWRRQVARAPIVSRFARAL